MMTRRDYRKIAAALKSTRDSYALHWDKNLFRACDDNAHAIAQVLANDNPRFDFARFYAACGVSP